MKGLAGGFSEWRRFPVDLTELCINTTLPCGQSFGWQKLADTGEWRCTLNGRLLSLRQDPEWLHYRYAPSTASCMSHQDTEALLKRYFNLGIVAADLYRQWSASDPNFMKKAQTFTGIRILKQDAWEALVGFICSSNNNISRITQMIQKLRLHFGTHIIDMDETTYRDFPSPAALASPDVESKLRGLGFGYRARYIYKTACTIVNERPDGWLDSLKAPEDFQPTPPAADDNVAVKSDPEVFEMPSLRGREGYRAAHAELMKLPGVGPKVADCVCLMGLGWGEAVPVDTHVWQIAQRDYKFNKHGSSKTAKTNTLSAATYDAVADHFRSLWGLQAGWAHSVLFTADLKSFAEKAAAGPSARNTDHTVKVKIEDNQESKQRAGDRKDVAIVKEEDGLGAETEPILLKREVDEDTDRPSSTRRKRIRRR